MFKKINNVVLESTDNAALEILVLTAIKVNSNYILTDILVKYLDDNSVYKSQTYRNNLKKFDKPNHYTSLFSEDI